MPRKPESPYERLLRRALALGTLDAQEGGRPQQMPQILDALGLKTKLHPSQLAEIKSCYGAGFTCANLED